MIENIGEPRHVGHRLTIGTNPEIDRNGGTDVEVLSRRLRAQFPEEGKEVVGVIGRKLVTIANAVRRFPAKMKEQMSDMEKHQGICLAHSKSTPSRLYLATISRTALTNLERFAGATAEEK